MYLPSLQRLASSNLLSPASTGNAAAGTASSTPSNDGTGGLDTMFLQLLSAQLKAQSPLDPLDPNQFVAQLAQFQSLSELTQIDQQMQTLVTNTTPAESSSH
jgi:flagellar basal-body rod modification protein FlgD